MLSPSFVPFDINGSYVTSLSFESDVHLFDLKYSLELVFSGSRHEKIIKILCA